MSDGGKPYLLCSDFMREAGGSGATLKAAVRGEGSGAEAKGRLPLESVLGQVRQCRAGLKLVLLDCSHIAANPRLGMVVNEFPRLLEGSVKKIDDPSLWVLSCSRPLEVSRVSYTEKRSLFAHFVTQGLRGSADASDEGVVDLAEFYGFVRDGVANAVEQQGGRAETERPMLLHGGEGVVAEPPRHFLFRVRRKTAAEEETPEPAKQEVAAAEKGAAAGKKDADATPAAPRGFPKAEIRSLLAKAWEWRDKVQGHAGSGNWSPVDYAPSCGASTNNCSWATKCGIASGPRGPKAVSGNSGPWPRPMPSKAGSAGGPSAGAWQRPSAGSPRKRPWPGSRASRRSCGSSRSR